MKRKLDGRAPMTLGRNTAAVLAGEVDLSEWDDEEIMRGQRRAKNGKWVGRPPLVVPQAVHQERIKRLMSEAGRVLQGSTLDAVKLWARVVRDDDAPYSDRLKASQLITERTLGKVTEKVHVAFGGEEPPWLQALGEAFVVGDDDDIIDAEIIEDPDDEIIWAEELEERARTNSARVR
jgi:hypothetical protein